MSVSRSNVRFASVPALPSRKQGRGLLCGAQPSSDAGQQLRIGRSSRLGRGCALGRCPEEGGHLPPRGALSSGEEMSLSFPRLQGCLVLCRLTGC